RLLGLGRAADDDAAAGADLCRVPDSAAVGERADAARGGLLRGLDLRDGGHSDRVHGEPVVANAASGAGALGRRLARPAHAFHAVLRLRRAAAGVLVLGAGAAADRGAPT